MPSYWDRIVAKVNGTEFRRATELELKAQSVFGVKIHAGGRLLSLEQPSQLQLWLTAGAGLGLNPKAASKYQNSIYPKLQANASLVEIGTVETSRMAFPSLETKILLQVPHMAVVNGQRISQIALVVDPFDLNTPKVILKAGYSNDIETPALITRRLPFPVSLGGGYHNLLITTMHLDADGMVALRANQNPLSLRVTLGGGRQAELDIEANDALYDDDGYIRVLAVRFDDGAVGNFLLLPRNTSRSAVSRLVKDLIDPLGVSLAGSRLVKDGRSVPSLARFLAQRGSPKMESLVETSSIQDSAYFAVDNGEQFIAHPIRLK